MRHGGQSVAVIARRDVGPVTGFLTAIALAIGATIILRVTRRKTWARLLKTRDPVGLHHDFAPSQTSLVVPE